MAGRVVAGTILSHLTRGRLASVCVFAAALGFLLAGVASGAGTTGIVAYRASPGTVTVTITDWEVVFGNVGPGVTLDCAVDSATCPTIKNASTDSETILNIKVNYTTDPEASCSQTDWESTIGAPAEDTFRMYADISSSIGTSAIPNGPTLSDDLYTGTALAVDATVSLLIRLQTPPSVTGTLPSVCTIGLLVTIAAANDE